MAVDQYAKKVILQLRATDGGFVEDSLCLPLTGPAPAAQAGFVSNTTMPKFGAASMHVSSVGGYLFAGAGTNANDPTWSFSTGDFTIDFWYRRASSVTNAEFSLDISPALFKIFGDGRVTLTWPSSTGISLAAGTVALNQWSFISLTRISGVFYLHIGGVQVASVAGAAAHTIQWGWSLVSGSPGGQTTGYFDDFRITKGVARYSSSTYTTPVEGLASFQPTFPLPMAVIGSDQYSANVVLQVRSESGSLKNDVDAGLPTVSGSAVTLESSPAGAGSKCIYVGAAGTSYIEYLNVPGLSAIGTGAYTLDFWIQMVSSNNAISIGGSGTGAGSWNFALYPSSHGGIQPYDMGGGGSFSPTKRLPVGKWAFVSVCRTGTDMHVHINGVYAGTKTGAAINITRTSLLIQGRIGYLDDLRMTVGVCRYGPSDYDAPIKGLNGIPISLSGGVSWVNFMSTSGGMYPACIGDVNFSRMSIDAAMRVDTFGGVVFKTPIAAGVASIVSAGIADVRFNSAYAQGTACGERSGVLFNTLDVAAAGVMGLGLTGGVQFSTPQLDSTGVFYMYARGMCLVPLGVVEGSAFLGTAAVGEVIFTKQVNGVGAVGTTGYSEIIYPPMLVKSVAGIGGIGFGSVKFDSPSTSARAL